MHLHSVKTKSFVLGLNYVFDTRFELCLQCSVWTEFASLGLNYITQCSVRTLRWVFSLMANNFMPTISPFGISDKNNYESKFMCKNWHTVQNFQNWSFASLITHIFLTCISPIQYAQYLQVITHISCTIIYLLLFSGTLSPPFWQ